MNSDMVIGLKTEVNRQSGMKRWAVRVGNHTQKHLVNSWRLAYATGVTDELIEMIWNYVLTTPPSVWRQENSKVWGIKTTLGEYKNKQGVVSIAHFTETNHYYGSVKQFGDKPIFYTGNFRVTRERFVLDISKLPEIQMINGVYNLGHLFHAVLDEDDIPISILIERKRIEKKKQVPVARV